MSCKSFCWYTRTVLFLLLLPGSQGLRNVYMIIPEAVERGKPAVIRCIYDLEKEDLYQIKWYRGDREFCRYSPRDVPPLKIFPISGIDVDLKGSDSKQVTIRAATKTAHGRYTCEVSADAPSFVTARIHGSMYVVDLPKSDLEFIGLKPRYKPGMKLKAECISYNSMPPANMSFFVNNKPTQSDMSNDETETKLLSIPWIHRAGAGPIALQGEECKQLLGLATQAPSQHVWHRVSGGENGSLWTAYITLQFVVQRHHFINGKLRIRCSAFIYSIYSKSDEQVTNGERSRTTVAPVPVTDEAILYPTRRITDNASCNLKSLWTESYLALITLVLQSVR